MDTADKFEEFVRAQDAVYDTVLRELAAGRKRSHWIWFIFPQLAGLGSSHMARKFGISSLAEARSYFAHAVLGPRLRDCTRLMVAILHDDISAVMGYPDDLKFRSSMTLFAAAASPESREEPLFSAALDKFFGGQRDPLTLDLLAREA